jgi:hypothetical protein
MTAGDETRIKSPALQLVARRADDQYLYAFISTAVASIPDHSGVPGAPDQAAC